MLNADRLACRGHGFNEDFDRYDCLPAVLELTTLDIHREIRETYGGKLLCAWRQTLSKENLQLPVTKPKGNRFPMITVAP